jgi:IS30 family transposase
VSTQQKRGRVYLDDVDHLLSFGLSLETIAQRLGVRVESIRQALRRREKREASDQARPAEQQRAVA